MKVRFTARSLRIRIDDLELDKLERGEMLMMQLSWPGGGWQVQLNPASQTVEGAAGRLEIGLLEHLARLVNPENEGVTLNGPPQIVIEKDFGPQHQ